MMFLGMYAMGMLQTDGACAIVHMSGGCVDEAGRAFLRPVTSHLIDVCREWRMMAGNPMCSTCQVGMLHRDLI